MCSEPQNHLLLRRNIGPVWCNKWSWIYLLIEIKKRREKKRKGNKIKMNASGKQMIAFWLHKKGEQWALKSVDKDTNPEVNP